MSKIQNFNGTDFRLCADGYYRDAVGKYLHRCVWEYYNCPIPQGYEIHHIDLNKNNNDISNLRLMSVSEHKKLHGSLLTDEQRDWRRDNLETNARPKAVEWHKSETGHEWHKQQIAKQRENDVFKKELICTNCGKSFVGEKKGENTFCCNACKSAYRRRIGADNITKTCPMCGKSFETNKYKNAETCSRSCANRLRAVKNREWISSIRGR